MILYFICLSSLFLSSLQHPHPLYLCLPVVFGKFGFHFFSFPVMIVSMFIYSRIFRTVLPGAVLPDAVPAPVPFLRRCLPLDTPAPIGALGVFLRGNIPSDGHCEVHVKVRALQEIIQQTPACGFVITTDMIRFSPGI